MVLTRRRGAVLVGTLVAVAATSTPAGAVTPTVTADDGNPVPITPGAVIRNMDPTVAFALAPGEGYVNATFTGPDGAQAASPLSCTSTSSRSVGYRGNGVYTVTVQAFGARDFSCRTPLGPPVTAQYAVSAGIGLSGPRGRVLIRERNSFSTREIRVAVDQNPGASTTELRYARGGVVGADGGISGPSEQGFVDRGTGTAGLRLRTPGTYVVVARAQGFASGGTFYTPWSSPLVIRAVAPFDLDRVSFPDSRGPSYQLLGDIREPSARGRVRISIAAGARGGYRSLGVARIRPGGTFLKRFRQASPGVYRIRYRYAGSATVAPGTVVQQVRITRRFTFG